PWQIANGVNVRLIGENARDAFAELVPDLTLVSSMGYLQELLGHPGRKQIHVAPVAVPRRVLSAHFGGYEVAPRWQGLAGLDLRRDILGCAAFEAIDAYEVVRPFRSRLGFAEGQAAPARLRHQLRPPAAGETGGIGVLVVNPDVHVQPLGLIEGDLPQTEPVGGQ